MKVAVGRAEALLMGNHVRSLLLYLATHPPRPAVPRKGPRRTDSSRSGANLALALALAGAAAVLYILAVFVAEESNADWLWPVSAVVGGAGAITGWSAGTPRPRGRALAAVVLGGLIFAVVLLWVIVAAISGDL